ncbi:MAG TPA: hypothetical protein VNE58_10275 [Casimicrobiaceae bacterium]|nr:hypothetical protein [Casimicrobiaceae bacterium]
MKPDAIVLVDSVTTLDARHRDHVIVTGSHAGLVAARYVAAAHARAAIFNDAGVGRDDAGIAGLGLLESIGLAATAVSHTSARIGDARDTYDCGVVTHANLHARDLGVQRGASARNSAHALRQHVPVVRDPSPMSPPEGRTTLHAGDAANPRVIALDSIGLVQQSDAGAILVIGSHGGLHGGDPASALPVVACAAFFHDAGRGKDDAGITRLPVLDARAIPAATIDYRSARIGDARSMWHSGVVSFVNATIATRGARIGMTLKESVAALLASAQST